MIKKSLFIILIIMCVVLFIPKDTFALQVYNNVNIDYRFFVDEYENDVGNLKFKLYDKSGALSFESEYYANSKQYIFGIEETSFVKRFADGTGNVWGYYWDLLDNANSEPSFREYIPYRDILYNIKYTYNVDDVSDFLSSNKLNGSVWINNYTWNYYTYIPMILEESNSGMKKIVFASVSVRNEHSSNVGGSLQTSFTQLYLVNNTKFHWQETTMLNESFLDNIDFMRKTILDYSDELWEELNNGPIASSEIYSDNKSSDDYKYINQSINGGTRDVPEETLEDYASSLPVLSFKKVDSTDENKDNNTNNIVNVITNPKTWNNGVIVLVIFMIIVIGSSFVLIKRKNN